MTMTYDWMTAGGKDAESAAKGLLVNTRFPPNPPCFVQRRERRYRSASRKYTTF